MDLWMYIAIIVASVIFAFWGLKNGRWLAFFAGTAVAVFSTFGSGIV